MEDKQNKNVSWWQPGAILFLRLSSWIVGPVLIAVLIGKYLDKTFQTTPWAFLFSVAAAFAVSIVMIIRIGLREMDNGNSK
ncbi:MAG: AtpZ/AtpI family protein [bacterium]